MTHQIHSAYGTSTGHGSDDWESPFQGILQGNQFGPPSWAITSSPMFKMLRAEGYGFKLNSPLSRKELHVAGMAFIDDTDTLQNAKKTGETGANVLRHAQGNVEHWEGAIRATGGALDPHKTHWFLDFTWKAGQWSYKPMNQTNEPNQYLKYAQL